MATIVPAIVPASRRDLMAALQRLSGLCEEVQIDAVDGAYAAPASWPCSEGDHVLRDMRAAGDLLPEAAGLRFEADLMVHDPEVAAGAWIDLGASRVVLHLESAPELGKTLDRLDAAYGHDRDFDTGMLEIGIALGTATDPERVVPFLDRIDFVQFMGVARIGVHGEPFDPGVLPRVAAFRKAHPDVPVQVDGGVSLANAPALLSAGVSRLIVGSAIRSAPSARDAIAAFTALADEYGAYT